MKIIIGLLIAQILWLSFIDFRLIKIFELLKDWKKENRDKLYNIESEVKK